MGFQSSFWSWLFLFVLVALLFSVGAAEASPAWSTYHGQDIYEIVVSDTGVTLGYTGRGAVFLLARDSTFIASWSREEDHRLESLILSKDGKYAAVCYEDGYTALFTHDGQKGEYLWAYNINQAKPSSLSMDSTGFRLGISNTPVYEEDGERYEHRSTVYLFSRDGTDIWRRVVDSSITTMAIDDEGSVVVGGSTYRTPLGERGRDAIYYYDKRGDLIWDRPIDGGVQKVSFTLNGILVLGEGSHFYFYNFNGDRIWDVIEEVDVAHFSSLGYVAGFYQNKIFLLNPDGERAWVHGIDEIRSIALSDEGLVAVVTDKDLTLWNEEGVEVFYYNPRREIYSLSLSSEGRFLVLGMDRVSQFVLP